MNAIFRSPKLLGSAAAMVLLSVAYGGAPHAAAWATQDNSHCEADCFETLETGGLKVIYMIDAMGIRHHLATLVEDPLAVSAASGSRASVSRVTREPMVLSAKPSKVGINCGVDGYGWEAGEEMWARSWQTSSNPPSRADARSVYLARGRASVITTTVTTLPNGGISTTTTENERPAAPKPGSAGCEQAK